MPGLDDFGGGVWKTAVKGSAPHTSFKNITDAPTAVKVFAHEVYSIVSCRVGLSIGKRKL